MWGASLTLSGAIVHRCIFFPPSRSERRPVWLGAWLYQGYGGARAALMHSSYSEGRDMG